MTVVGARLAGARVADPAADRPWISGTSDNSIWSLILGYNGLGRVFGQSGGPGGAAGGPGGGGRAAPFGGDAGPLRLLNQALGGQAGWLLGVAVVGGLGLLAAHPAAPRRPAHRLAARRRRRVPDDRRRVQPRGGHLPPVLRLPARAVHRRAGRRRDGAGPRRGTVARIAGPVAVAPASVTEIAILRDNAGQLTWWPPLLAAGGVAAAAPRSRWCSRPRGAGARGRRRDRDAAARARHLGRQTLGHATSGTFPAGGGPATAGGGRPAGGGGMGRRPARRTPARRAGWRPAAGCSAATRLADRRRSPTPTPTAAARSPWPASPAPPAR